MKTSTKYFLFMFLLLTFDLSAQNWPVVIGNSISTNNAFASEDYDMEPANIIKTFDDKIVVTGYYFLDDNWDIYLWKMNSNLEDDSIYTQPRVYDSLCPYPIVSDTIDLDCGLYVDIGEIPTREEYENPLKVFPNPASNTIHLQTKTGSGKEVVVVDIFGKQVSETAIAKTGAQQIDVSSWPAGLYLFSLFENGRYLKSKKVVVR